MNRLERVSFLALTSLALAGCSDDGGGRDSESESATGASQTAGDDGTAGSADGTAGTASGTATAGDDDGTGGGSGDSASGTADDGTAGDSADDGTASDSADDGTTASTSDGTTASTSDGSTSTATSASTTDGSGSDTTGTTGGLVPCETASATLEPIPPNIHLVLDKSGSMVQNTWDHDSMPATPQETRWLSLYDVVEFVVGTFENQINFGCVLFPGLNEGSIGCSVATNPNVAVGPMNANAILGVIPDRDDMGTEVSGATPTTKGVNAAYNDLKAQGGSNAPAVILVTDGAANCMAGTNCGAGCPAYNVYDDDLLPAVTDAWTNDGIPTYVVGIDIVNMTYGMVLDGTPDNINPYDKMDELATAGGKPNPNGPPAFYQTTNQIELQAALQDIIDDSLSCTVELVPPPPFPDEIEVFIGGNPVPLITDCATQDGYLYVPPNPPWVIELCGTACDDLKAQGQVDINYYCTPG